MRADSYTFTLVENEDGSRFAIVLGPGCPHAFIMYGEWAPELAVAAHKINRERFDKLMRVERETGVMPACCGPTMVNEEKDVQ